MKSNREGARRARLLLLAFLCHPGAGSEAGGGWQWALQAANDLDCWVLCDEFLNGAAIRRYLEEHGPIPGLEFVFVPARRWELLLRRLPAVCYVAYNRWHYRAYRIARRLHQRFHFDLTHQPTLNTFREPGYLWKLNVPFVWGPVGGTQMYPWRCLAEAGFYGAVSEGFRNLVNFFQLRFSRRVQRAARAAAALLAATSTNQRDFARFCMRKPARMVDVGVVRTAVTPRTAAQQPGPMRILWSGNLLPGKALSLLIKALALLPADVPYELRVLGKGRCEDRWRRLARRRGIEPHIRWMGFLPHVEALRQYEWADLFVFTSLRDTTGNVIVEALAAGVPVVCLDHQGAHDIVNEACGVKVPVSAPREIVRRLSETLAALARDRATLALLGRGALSGSREYLWSRQGATMRAVYRRVLEDDNRATSCDAVTLTGLETPISAGALGSEGTARWF